MGPPFLSSALDGGELLPSHSGRFTPGEKAKIGWMRPGGGLDSMKKRKILPLLRNGIPAVQPHSSHDTNSAIFIPRN